MENQLSITAFAIMVEQMRSAQKLYFLQIAKAKKTKLPADYEEAKKILAESKKHEQLIDQTLEEIFLKATQLELFNDEMDRQFEEIKVRVDRNFKIILDSKQSWCNDIPRKLPQISNREKFLFIDKKGNHVLCGADFTAAEKLESYPVTVYITYCSDQDLNFKYEKEVQS